MNILCETDGMRTDSAPSWSEGNPHKRILVVEDDEGLRSVNLMILSQVGYAVQGAEDGLAGWQALNARCFDMLITDNDMPRWSGMQLIQEVHLARMMLPIIMASGMVPEALLDDHTASGVAATLTKPFTAGELLNTVRQVFEAERHLPGHADRPGFLLPIGCDRTLTRHWGINE